MWPKALDDVLPQLWKLVVNLRAGCDRKVLPRPENLRRANRRWNWHQALEHETAMLRKDQGVSGNRISRMAAWCAVSKGMAEQLGKGEVPVPETLSTGDVLLALPPQKPAQWQVVCVLCFGSDPGIEYIN